MQRLSRLAHLGLLATVMAASCCRPAGSLADDKAVGSTVQLPTFGVAIDAAGELAVKTFTDPGGRLRARRLAAARAALPRDLMASSPLRMVSLPRLEQEVRRQLAAGGKLDAALQYLAGLQRVQYVFLYPDSGDVVIAGPAEGWIADASGRAVGVSSGRPVLELADLAVALRTFPPGRRDRPFVGCTIDPSRESLSRVQQFQRTIPRVIPQARRRQVALQVAQGLQQSLGLADIRVFGVPATTHVAQVMVEADYRMKLIGVGLEPPPVQMATFAGALQRAPRSMLQRWWFTPHYECVRVSDDGLAVELVGQGVQLQTEDKVIGPGGKLLDSAGPPGAASQRYAQSFTQKYPQIADRSPVFAQLRNIVDLLVAAAHLQQQDYYGRASWPARVLLDEAQLATETLPAPRRAPCAANALWKGARLLAPAGGGVSIQPHLALQLEQLLGDDQRRLPALQQQARPPAAARWWWDGG